MRFPTRRQTLGSLFAAGMMSALPRPVSAQSVSANIVVIGGGFGGASAARFVRRFLPSAKITLVTDAPRYLACPFSNLVIAGERTLRRQTFSYNTLEAEGIRLALSRARDIDPERKTVSLENDATLFYDRLILSPGVDIRWGALEGYDPAAADIMPHAWKAGLQTTLLQQRLAAMEDGALVVISVPEAPYRCPPGPYERASLIAHYLKTQKPRSKLLVLDAKDRFSKMSLFQEEWADHYPDHLEWRSATDDGRVSRVDAASGSVYTDFEEMTPSVVNIIPPQKAGEIADRAGVTDTTGWCPINATTFESTLRPDVHVIGDACIANPMPKSAFSANLQGKVCALQVARLLSGQTPRPTLLTNTCYSYVTPDEAISITGVYETAGGAFASIEDAGGLSPTGAPADIRRQEALEAADWFNTITAEAFG